MQIHTDPRSIRAIRTLYRDLHTENWTLFAVWDETTEPDDGQGGPVEISTDVAVLAAELARDVPGVYSSISSHAASRAGDDTHGLPIPAVWRQEVFDTHTNEILARVDYSHESEGTTVAPTLKRHSDVLGCCRALPVFWPL